MGTVYGIQIEVEGSAIKTINGMDTAFHKLDTDAKHAAKSMDSHFSGIKNQLGGMKSLIMGATGLGVLFSGFEFAKSSLEAFDKR